MDVVITYVDINDNFINEYNTYCTKELQENRFRSYGVLDLQVKQIRKYMPYVKNIFIVVSNEDQISQYSLPDCKIVKHSDIIPDKYLPCYNSCTIEMFLWKIPGLAEEFVYFNDDMFVLDYIHHTKWFIKGKPCLYPKKCKITDEITNTFYKRCINSTNLAAKILNCNDYKDIYLLQEHCPKPYLKSTCEKIFNLKNLEVLNSLTRTRHSRNYNCYLFNDYDFISNNCYVLEKKYLYMNIDESIDTIITNITSKKSNIICINDNNKYINFNKLKIELRNSLEANLLNKEYSIPKKDNKTKYKKVIYTCITNNYDNLLEPLFISNDFDYICFTDNIKLKSNTWKILPIPKELEYLSKVKQQRNIKINAHKYLSNYDLSIWVDSSVKLNGDINDIICNLNFKDYNIFIPIHPQRNCIYEEGKACIKLKKDTAENINKELDFFRLNNMPENFGLYETNVMIRLHNQISCITLMNEWWYYLNLYSHRDQISLPYCLWKLNYKKIFGLEIGFNHTNYFNWIGGLHKKINICIIHYNTPELTNALIKSINKYTKRAIIYLFDNSTEKPFTYKYDNLLYLDNTEGQYINFNKWLENYPNRVKSKEHIGNYGSARHSISVQKCMEIIDDNFILMDSDILLKRDISGFVNNKCVYVGQSDKQKNGLYRVLPFCLFINVNMCKKYNIPWFDENYMHGLYKTKEADRYDTGGAFYVHTRDLPYKEVNLNNFIVHYKGGSWEEKYMKIHNLTLTSKEWLEINKKYWD